MKTSLVPFVAASATRVTRETYYVVVTPTRIDGARGRFNSGARISMAHQDPDCYYLGGRADLICVTGPVVAQLGYCTVCCDRQRGNLENARDRQRRRS